MKPTFVYEYTFTRHQVGEFLGTVRAPTDVADLMMERIGNLEQEEFHVILLNTKNKIIGHQMVYRGNLAGAPIRVGEVFRDAVRLNAAAIIVAHNHPSGDTEPSAPDIQITSELSKAGTLLDIELLDHLIIGDGRWASLRALGVLGMPDGPGSIIEALVGPRP